MKTPIQPMQCLRFLVPLMSVWFALSQTCLKDYVSATLKPLFLFFVRLKIVCAYMHACVCMNEHILSESSWTPEEGIRVPRT